MNASNRSPAGDIEVSQNSPVRAVTETEVALFKENGWALLRGLVKPEFCKPLLELGKARMAGLTQADGAAAVPEEARKVLGIAGATGGKVTDIKQWVEWRGAVRSAREPDFCRVALAKVMGRNAQRLLGRDKPMRIYHDILTCKLPDNASTPTSFHQDATNFPLDRNVLTFWIALDEVAPNQGPVQFYSGSHRLGLLGGIPARERLDLTAEYPDLADLPLSPAHHLQPGDCTVHHGLVVHGASANSTARPRWSYLVSYFPADARYTGAPNLDTDGFELKIGHAIDHPSFAVVDE
jgi:hypothetical protein